MSGHGTETETKPRKKHGVVVSELVTELLRILNVAAPEPAAAGRAAPAPTGTPPKLEDEAARLLTGVKALLEGIYKTNPPGATTGEGEKLDAAREKLRTLCQAIESDTLKVRHNEHMPLLKQRSSEIATEYRATKEAVEARAQKKHELQTSLGSLFSGKIDGATDVENADLVDKSKRMLEFLEAESKRDDPAKITKGYQTFEENLPKFAKLVDKYTQAVINRQGRKEQLLREEADVKAPADAGATALDAAKDKVRVALDKTPLDDAAISAGELALTELTQERDRLATQFGSLRRRYTTALAQLDVIDDKAKGFTGAINKKDRETIENGVASCRAKLEPAKVPLSETALDEFSKALFDLRQKTVTIMAGSAGNQNAKVGIRAYMEAEARRLRDEAASIPDLGVTELIDLKAEAVENYKEFDKKIRSKEGGAAAVVAKAPLQDLLAGVSDLRTKAGPAALKLAEAAIRTRESVDQVDVSGFADKFQKKLKQLRADVGKTLGGVISQTEVDTAADLADQFRNLVADAKKDLQADGAVKKAQSKIASTFDGIEDAANDATKVELQRLRERAAQLASLTGDDRDMIGAAKLYAKLEQRLDAASKEKPVPDGAFATITISGGAVPESVRKTVQGLVGKSIFEKLPPAKRTALCEAAAANGPQIKALFEEGLGGDAAVSAALLEHCDGPSLGALAKAFAGSDKTSRENLRGLIEEGGIAEHPRALASMLSQGIDTVAREGRGQSKDDVRTANAGALKGLADAFTDKAARATLTRMLSDCGLGGSPGDAPPAIGSVLRDGCKGNPAALLAFGKSFDGDDKAAKTARANLKHMIDKAGIGEHPSVLGPLVQRASGKKQGDTDMQNGAAKLKEIGAAFAGEKDAAKLKGLLDNGGMSGDLGNPGEDNEHEHPDTLAKVFMDGVKGNATDLKRFVNTFEKHPDQCKEMLDGFNSVKDASAAFRQPGKKLAKLLEKMPIESLQPKFTDNVVKITDKTKREQAFRFGPHLMESPEQSHNDDFGEGIDEITASVEGRHKTESFNKSRMKDTAPNSLFPPGQSVPDLLKKTLAGLPGVNKNNARQTTITISAKDLGIGESDEPGFNATDTITVEVGFLDDTTVNHFGPRNDKPGTPFETPKFTTEQMNHLIKAIGK